MSPADGSRGTAIQAAGAEYARAGFALCRLLPNSKAAHEPGWNTREHAITDPDVIAVWHGNVGGLLAFSGLVSIDVDDMQSACAWLEARGVNLMQLLCAPDALRIESGVPNRTKLIYKAPDGVDPLSLMTRRILDTDHNVILEFRCAGRNGVSVQDVLPPSIHPGTRLPYRWHGDWRNPPALPDVLLREFPTLDGPKRSRAHEESRGTGNGEAFRDVLARLARLGCKPEVHGAGDARAFCPNHGGKSGTSLHINEKPDGKVLLCCHAGCSQDDVLTALGFGPGPEVHFGLGTGERRNTRDDAGDANGEPWLREVPLAGVATAPSVGVSFAVSPILPRGEVTILGGHGGAGKSICALSMAAAAACGVTWCGFEPEGPLKVAYVSLEDHGDIVRSRLRNILHDLRIAPQLIDGGLRVFDGSDGATALAVEVNDHGVRTLTMTPQWRELVEVCADADIIIVDNASDAYAADENNRAQVRSFMRHLRALARQHNAAVVLLCHIDKMAARGSAQGNSYSGSTAWHNASRSRLALIPNSDGMVLLVHERSSHRKAAEPVALGWSDTGVLLPLTGQQRAAEVGRDAEDVLGVLARAEQLGIRIPTATRGSSTAWHAVADLSGLPAWLSGRQASRRFHAALLWLAEAGPVVHVSLPDGHGHKREFWKLASPAGGSA